MVTLRRPGRRTNLALFLLLAGAFVTGWLAFAVGTSPESRAVDLLHGTLGLGILVLAPWKTVIARRGLRRSRSHGLGVTLAVVVLLCLLSGIAHATLGPLELHGLSVLDVHVGSAIALVPLALVHVVRRPQRPRPTDLSRRTALRAIAVGGAASLTYGAVESASSLAGLPGSRRRGTGSYAVTSSAPAGIPVTQWLLDEVPSIELDSYALMVSRPGEPVERLSYNALLSMADTSRSAILDCTGGWWVEQTWRGVRLATLLGVPAQGSIVVGSVTGYTRRFPPEDARSLLLATHLGDVPLSPGHGAPLRLVAPGRRGFWWVKWVDHVSIEPGPWWAQSPFPLQ